MRESEYPKGLTGLSADRQWKALLTDLETGAELIVGHVPTITLVVDLYDDAAKLTQVVVSNTLYPRKSLELAAKAEHAKERALVTKLIKPPRNATPLRLAQPRRASGAR